ncbi:MAG: hypothetical protein ABR599_08890 [Gemmatimonadota bacterium]
MHVLALSPAAVAHAVRRFRAYGNSPAAIARHHARRGERAREHICRMVHGLELRYGIDLGSLCARFEGRHEAGVPAFEREVLELLAEWSHPREGAPALVVRVDRVRALNALASGGAAALRDEALSLARALARRGDPVQGG